MIRRLAVAAVAVLTLSACDEVTDCTPGETPPGMVCVRGHNPTHGQAVGDFACDDYELATPSPAVTK